MKYFFIIGFVVMIAAQWYVPMSMVVDAEKTVEEGYEYKFRTRPVDPGDPFRGSYIVLDYDIEDYRWQIVRSRSQQASMPSPN